jgi:hypothetical protein
MNNVVEFPLKKQYTVRFKLPETSIIKVNKTPDDKINLNFKGSEGIAILKAESLEQAISEVRRILPNSTIIIT